MPSQYCWAGLALLGQHRQTCIARASITRQKHGHACIARRAWRGQHGQASMGRPAWPRLALLANIARAGLPGQQCQFHWGGKRLHCYLRHSGYPLKIFDGICEGCGGSCAPSINIYNTSKRQVQAKKKTGEKKKLVFRKNPLPSGRIRDSREAPQDASHFRQVSSSTTPCPQLGRFRRQLWRPRGACIAHPGC